MTMEKNPYDKTLLICNPASGAPSDSAPELMDALASLQRADITPKVYLVTPETDLERYVRAAIRSGTRLVVVQGGDGTIDRVACGAAGTSAVLGILPGGTQNNIARSLGIPIGDIEAAVKIMQEGKILKSDMGKVRIGSARRCFFETAGVGLISDLFPAADEIQHGNLARLGEFFSTLFTSTPSHMALNLDRGKLRLNATGHLLLVANMPYFGLQFQPAANISCTDGLLDVIIYSNLTKLDLLGYAVMASAGVPEDDRVQHFQVREIAVDTEPGMQVMADGTTLGMGAFKISIKPGCVNVMVPTGSVA